MRVLRVFHAGRDRALRAGTRAMAAAGIDVTLVVPSQWAESGSEEHLSRETFQVIELPVTRSGDVNRHRHEDDDAVRRLIREHQPDVLDLFEEPVSLVARQWLAAAPPDLPVTLYTAQNIDKRFPPPFARHEVAALERVDALYPCSRQAASVARGKGFTGAIEVLPLGYDDTLFHEGEQSLDDDMLVLGLVGRMVPEKGVTDAVDVLAAVHAVRPTRLLLVGSGPEIEPALGRAAELGVADRVEVVAWVDAERLAALYRTMHVVLVPSTATARWVEQFGRVIVEAHASGAVVAAYASGAISEVVANAGLLAAEGDVAGLSRQVAAIVTDETGWSILRQAGLDVAATRTWESVSARHVAVYESALGARSPSPAGRAAALAEFGPPAVVLGERRPFALPVLRNPGAVPRALATMIDTGARLRPDRHPHAEDHA